MTQDILTEANFINNHIQQLEYIIERDSQGELHLKDVSSGAIADVVRHVLLPEFLQLVNNKHRELQQRFTRL